MRPPVLKESRRSHLQPCPRCGEANGITAIACWKCDLQLIPDHLLEPRHGASRTPPADVPLVDAEVPAEMLEQLRAARPDGPPLLRRRPRWPRQSHGAPWRAPVPRPSGRCRHASPCRRPTHGPPPRARKKPRAASMPRPRDGRLRCRRRARRRWPRWGCAIRSRAKESPMRWRVIAALVLGAGWGTLACAAAEYKIVTASERGTYIQIGRDIAKFVAPAADISLEVLPSAGSAENVQRLRYEPGVKFAMVQSDVYQAFLDLAASGNAEADDMIKPLRVIMPLYNEEIYFVARSDSPLNFVHEIKDSKINVGPLKSGTAMSATTIYRQMFNAAIPDTHVSYLSNEDGLVKLIGDKSID